MDSLTSLTSDDTTLRDALTAIVGVWEGTYSHLEPDGRRIETFPSRQETRLDGDRWYERIIYRRDGREPEVLDFRGVLHGDDDMVMQDVAFEGRSRLVAGRYLLFPYRWTAEPDVEIVELITFVSDDYRTRLWQRYRSGRLDRITVIEEHRRPGETAEVWY